MPRGLSKYDWVSVQRYYMRVMVICNAAQSSDSLHAQEPGTPWRHRALAQITADAQPCRIMRFAMNVPLLQ